jgi:hypothetical protein
MKGIMMGRCRMNESKGQTLIVERRNNASWRGGMGERERGRAFENPCCKGHSNSSMDPDRRDGEESMMTREEV